jgi:autotransporter-associated beta strand protein
LDENLGAPFKNLGDGFVRIVDYMGLDESIVQAARVSYGTGNRRGCNLVGSGVVAGKVSAGLGSTINATGNLTLGDSTAYDGFYSDGELYTNGSTVTLNAASTSAQKNAVVLGALTEVEGGALVAPNGFFLDAGKTLLSNGGGYVSNVRSGSSARVIVTSGKHAISAPVSLASNLVISPSSGSTLQISGNIAGTDESLTLADAGTLILDGSDTYTGGTIVTDGTLVLSSDDAIAEGTSLSVGARAALVFDASAGGESPMVSAATSPRVAAVPEPGTLLLLAAGVFGAVVGRGVCVRRRKQ